MSDEQAAFLRGERPAGAEFTAGTPDAAASATDFAATLPGAAQGSGAAAAVHHDDRATAIE
ncbi:MAG: hypothetical protein IPN32_28610 [Deltaproteobacteria bacterium]|nr:hypothetical protein [Deltaproteobacteria bacterium]